MQIIVRAGEQQKKEWLLKGVSHTAIHFVNDLDEYYDKGDIFFDLLFDETKPPVAATDKPVFVNAVVTTLKELPPNFIRINGWNGFLQRGVIEIAAGDNNTGIVSETMAMLNWKYQLVPDIPGMIAPRIIGMIINEAYFALQDGVSTKEEIDIAMKLGANYPYGPFEWGEKIGLRRIYHLITKLNETDKRYEVSALLEAGAKAIGHYPMVNIEASSIE